MNISRHVFARGRLAFNSTRRAVSYVFTKHTFAANTVVCVSLFGCADLITQTIEIKLSEEAKQYDFERTGLMLKGACIFGPMEYAWYFFFIEKYKFKGSIHRVILKKITLDQFLFAPPFIAFFYVVMGMIEKKSKEEIICETKEKYLPTFLTELAVWPLLQTVNFYFVPPHLRMVYIGVASLCWDCTLSFFKNREHIIPIANPTST